MHTQAVSIPLDIVIFELLITVGSHSSHRQHFIFYDTTLLSLSAGKDS